MNLRELKDKFSVKELDEVKISTLNEEYTGIILPSANEKTLPIKLKSGYNIGVGTERITGIQKLGEAIKETPAEEKKIMKIKKFKIIPDNPIEQYKQYNPTGSFNYALATIRDWPFYLEAKHRAKKK